MRLSIILSLWIALIASACNLSSATNDTQLTSVPTATTQSQPTPTPIPTVESITPTIIVTNSGNSTSNNTVNTGTTVICAKQTTWTTYTVASGDTLFNIAQRANTSVDTLVTANCLVDAGLISVGQVLYVPSPVQQRVTPNIPPTQDPNRYTTELWWIIQGDNVTGFPVGCGDSIYLQQSGIPTNLSINETINRAFTYLIDDSNVGSGQGDRGWWNPISTTSLKVDNYTFINDALTANLSGHMSLSGVCFDAQLEAQIALNLMHLTGTKSATITINGENMRDTFDASGINTKTTYTWEEFQNAGTGNAEDLIEFWLGSETNAVAEAIEVGCDSYLVPIKTDEFTTDDIEADITHALTALFDPNRQYPSTVYTNFLNNQELSVQDISLNDGNATIKIGGELMGIGTCADPILEAQIIQTVFQFEAIQSVKVMNGETNLRQIVDMSGNESLVNYIYTRSNLFWE